MTDLVGKRLGQYDIIARIASGGMAEIYRARQATVEREVAIKVIKPDATDKTEFIQRFHLEAKIVASLRHPHILKVFDYGEQDDVLYIVTELMLEGSLADLLKRQGPLPLETASHIFDQIAAALDYAHQRGIVHRDLKPQNVLLDEMGNAYLTDFGIAKLSGETYGLTRSGVSMGTPTYMSPEQCRGDTVDARSDIYSLGVMLYEMLTRKVPFTAETPMSVLQMHLFETPPSILTFRAGLPRGVEQVINRALAKDARARFSAAGDLAAAFRVAISGGAVPPAQNDLTNPNSSAVSIPLPTASAAPRRTLPLALAGVIVLAVVAVATFLATRGGGGAATDQPTTAADTTAIAQMATSTSDATIAASTTPTATANAPETQAAVFTTQRAEQTAIQQTALAIVAATDNAMADQATQLAVASWTQTATVTPTQTSTPTNTPSSTVTSTWTMTPSVTHSVTPNATYTPSRTRRPTSTPPQLTTQDFVFNLRLATFWSFHAMTPAMSKPDSWVVMDDPYMTYGYLLRLCLADYSYISVEMAVPVVATTTYNSFLNVYYVLDEAGEFGEDRVVRSTSLTADGELHRYYYRLSALAGYQNAKYLTGIRLDPTDGSSANPYVVQITDFRIIRDNMSSVSRCTTTATPTRTATPK